MLGVPVTGFEAKRYDSIEQFIAGNFTSGPEGYFATNNKELHEHGVVWSANFTGLNKTYLSKPSKDLSTYCSATGGDIHHVPSNDTNLSPITHINQSDIQAYTIRTFNEYRQKFDEDLAAGLALNQTRISLLSHRKAVTKSKALHSILDQGYQSGLFGHFLCSKDNKLLWMASVQVEETPHHTQLNNMKALLRIIGRSK